MQAKRDATSARGAVSSSLRGDVGVETVVLSHCGATDALHCIAVPAVLPRYVKRTMKQVEAGAKKRRAVRTKDGHLSE